MSIARKSMPARAPRVVLALLSLAFALGACATDEHARYEYGQAAREIMASQVARPEAGDDTPVTGMDAAKAGKAAKVYVEGEKKEQQGVLEKIASDIGGTKPAASK